MAEIRYFLKQIENAAPHAVKISDTVWEKAADKLFKTYAGSSCLEICRNLLRDFETVNPDKYYNDLLEFIKESSYEDFYDDETEAVYVSTIHKAKGREFDTVYMMLNGNNASTDEEKRILYVGMTRAKHELYIHSNTKLFSAYNLPDIEHCYDKVVYSKPLEISLQMTHKDVFLDYFKNKKQFIFKLRSGSKLLINGMYFCAQIEGKNMPVVKFSKAFFEKIQNLQKKGYMPYAAEVRFIVAWMGKEDTEETAVILPDIYLKRNK